MKIAYFLDVAEGLGGAGNLLLQQAGVMSKRHEVIVVIPCDEEGNENAEYARRCGIKGLTYRSLYYETSFNFYYVDYLHAALSSKAIREFVIQEKIDFLHSVQLNLAVEMVSRELKIPHLMNIYQMRDEEFELAYMDVFAKYHLCDSNLYAEKWSSHLGIESRCVRPVAPLAHVRQRDHIHRDKYKITIIGNVCVRKNQLTAIKAVEQCLNEYDIILEIAGYCGGSYGDSCKAYVQQHNLTDNVYFRGFVNDISEVLEECDILLCASNDESFPMSIVEAVTYGLTIISTPVAGVPEVFCDQYNAYISKGFEVEDIVASIIDCVRSFKNGNIKTIQEHASQTWEQEFSPHAICERIDQYYQYIVRDAHIGESDLFDRILLGQLNRLSEMIRPVDGIPDYVCKRVYYYMYLKRRKLCGRAYIWGAGKLGYQAFELLRLLAIDVKLTGFIDRHKTGMYCGLPIINPDGIKFDEVDYFFIGFAEGRDEAIGYLSERGFAYNNRTFLLP